MRAAVCRAFGQPLVIEDLILDPVGPDEVRVEVAACAICHSDIHYSEGSWGGALPAVYGHEAAGTVAETGGEVRDVRVGDRVVVSLIRACGTCPQCLRGYDVFCEAGLGPPAGRLRTAGGERVEAGLRCGAFAEEATVHHSQVVPVPADLDWPAAAISNWQQNAPHRGRNAASSGPAAISARTGSRTHPIGGETLPVPDQPPSRRELAAERTP